MNLYEIDQAIQALVDPETGELLDFEAFEQLQMARETKIDNMACWVKDLLSDAKGLKAEEDALKARRQAKERKAESLKRYLGKILDGESFESSRCAISWRRSESLDVEDASACAKWLEANGYPYAVTYDAPKIDKKEVKALFKMGLTVPGASLVSNRNMGVK